MKINPEYEVWPYDFMEIALEEIILRRPRTAKSKTDMFRAFFKVRPKRAADLYLAITPPYVSGLGFNYKPIYLLYTLHFLYRYPVERILAVQLRTSRDTIRKVIWPTIWAMSEVSEGLVSRTSIWVSISLFALTVLTFSCGIRFVGNTGLLMIVVKLQRCLWMVPISRRKSS